MTEICAAPFRVLRIATALLITVVVCNVSFASAVSAQLDISDLKQKVVLIERARGGSLPPEIGAGFFVTPSGHILTAAHVLLNSDEPDDELRTRTVRVRLRDGSRYTGRILLLNRIVDLALLKIRADKPTPYLSLGTSESVRNGNQLIMVGHPSKDAEWDVSSGDVERITLMEHIHVRATLAPGNSGGPAINADGFVVGVVSYRAEAGEQSYLVTVDDARMLLAGVTIRDTGAGKLPVEETASARKEDFQPTQLTETPSFQNSFLHVTLRSFNRSSDKRKINLALVFENISKDDLLLSLTEGDENKYLIDDAGERWILYQKAVGITTRCAFGCQPQSLFNPGQSSVVLFPFKPTGEIAGKQFDFGANLIASIKESGRWRNRFKFSIGISSLVLPR